jgi:hypothetical protein
VQAWARVGYCWGLYHQWQYTESGVGEGAVRPRARAGEGPQAGREAGHRPSKPTPCPEKGGTGYSAQPATQRRSALSAMATARRAWCIKDLQNGLSPGRAGPVWRHQARAVKASMSGGVHGRAARRALRMIAEHLGMFSGEGQASRPRTRCEQLLEPRSAAHTVPAAVLQVVEDPEPDVDDVEPRQAAAKSAPGAGSASPKPRTKWRPI